MLDHVFTAGRIGELCTENRIVMPSMNARLPSDDGRVTDRTVEYYRQRARGGAGVLTFESTYPCHPHPNRYRITDDSYVDGLRRVVDTVHEEGPNLAVQMNVHRASADQHEPMSPSELTTPGGKTVRAIRRDEIRSLIEEFAAGAARAKSAGFDGIEIHAASGYLLHQFLSPYTNLRDDKYGGTLQNRTRFPRDLLAAVRDCVGPNYPVWFRLSGDEYLEGGITPAVAAENARVLAEAGSDAIHVTAGHHWNEKSTPSGYVQRAVYADLAEQIRSNVSVPVITVGRVNEPAVAEEVLAAEKADFVAMARAHLADPYFLKKAREGHEDRIRPCVGGLEGCYDGLNGAPVTCTVNARVGREGEPLPPVDDPCRIAVVGGGPAGMEVARVAGKRGHDVTLYEQAAELGGQMRWAKNASAKREYASLIRYYKAELDAYDVKVHRDTRIDRTDLDGLEFDELVIATGSVPTVSPVRGLSEATVAGVVLHPEDVLTDPTPSYDEAVIRGGDEVACDTAEYLAERDVNVSIVASDVILPDRVLESQRFGYRRRTLARFERNDRIAMLPDTRVSEIGTGTVEVVSGGDRHTVSCDRVVLAADRAPDRELVVDEGDSSVRVVGDATQVRNLYAAIHDANELGREL